MQIYENYIGMKELVGLLITNDLYIYFDHIEKHMISITRNDLESIKVSSSANE